MISDKAYSDILDDYIWEAKTKDEDLPYSWELLVLKAKCELASRAMILLTFIYLFSFASTLMDVVNDYSLANAIWAIAVVAFVVIFVVN